MIAVIVFNNATDPDPKKHQAVAEAAKRIVAERYGDEWADEDIVSGLPVPVGRAKDVLTSYYRERIYPTAKCGAKLVSGRYLIRCYPEDGGVPGGIIALSKQDGQVVVTGLNGKARGQLEAATGLRHRDGTQVRVKDLDEAGLRDFSLSIDMSKLVDEIR